MEDGFASPLCGVTWQDGGETKKSADLRWGAWAADAEGITGDGLLDFVNNTLFPALKAMEVGPKSEPLDDRDAEALDSAEAVLTVRLRAIFASGDFDEYWQFHETAEWRRNHAAKCADFVPKIARGQERRHLRLISSSS